MRLPHGEAEWIVGAMTRRKRTDWLDAGIDVLATRGVDALTIDGLAAVLGVTKGSFYHHFAGQADYRDALLVHWEEWGADALGPVPVTAAEALVALDRLVDSSPLGTDSRDPGMAIRFWATRDPAVRAFVERVDGRRLAHVENLLAVIVGDRGRASFLGRMLYALVLGAGHTLPPADHATLLAFYAEFKRLLATAG